MEAWRQRRTGEKEKTCLTKKLKNRLDSDRPSHGRPLRSKTPRRPGCGGDEGFVRREVVAVAHAAEGDGDGARRGVEVAGGVQPSAAWSGPPVSNGIERGALEEPTQARPATRPLSQTRA